MQKTFKQVLVVVVLAGAVTVLSGCTNWEKKYKSLDVEHQNLRGLYENCVASLDSSAAEKSQLSQELNERQTTIEQLQAQIKDQKATPAQATGFNVGEVSVDERAGTITVTLQNSILFSSGKASLLKTTSSELDQIYATIRERYRGRLIDVVGHTDTDPIRKTKDQWKDNWDLSAARALTVLRYLEGRGMQAENIRAVACGQSKPVASNSTSAGKARNRRVEIVVHMR